MIDHHQDRYLLVILPPPKIADFIDSYRRLYDQKSFNATVPHLTLLPPFYSKIAEPDLIAQLQTIFANHPSFEINLNRIGYFEGKNKVAFLKPDPPSTEKIKSLVKITQSNLADSITNVYSDYPTNLDQFIPHCTIAEHITDEIFPEIKGTLNKLIIDQQFEVDAVFLFKKIEGRWPSVAKIKFNMP